MRIHAEVSNQHQNSLVAAKRGPKHKDQDNYEIKQSDKKSNAMHLRKCLEIEALQAFCQLLHIFVKIFNPKRKEGFSGNQTLNSKKINEEENKFTG